ncbi:CHAT domain-containing protein [Streptomyces sp. NPDC056672]|uniref:CHAT domain-containing protein n=1 Tax=Streptomyces sp. NPDC056672 TaxID=3345906 RepID=UPI00368F1C0E
MDLRRVVQERIGRIARSQDFTLALADEALAEAQALTEALHGDESDVPARHVLGWFFYTRHLALAAVGKGERDREVALDLLEPVLALGYETVPAELRPALAERMVPTALGMEAEDEETAVAVVRFAVRLLEALPVTHPRWAGLARRTAALAVPFPPATAVLDEYTARLWERAAPGSAELDAVVTVLEAQLAALPENGPERPGYLSNLSLAFSRRYAATRDARDLEAAVRAGRSAVDGTPDDAEHRAVRAGRGHNLTSVLVTRYEREPTDDHLREAIDVARQCAADTPAEDPNARDRSGNLAVLTRLAHQRTDDPGDLRTAIDAHTAAVDLVPEPERASSPHVGRLGTLLWQRYGSRGDALDLSRALDLLQRARPPLPARGDDEPAIAHPPEPPPPVRGDDQRSVLVSLGGALLARHQRHGDPADLDDAVRCLEAVGGDDVIATTASANLGAVLWARHSLTGDPDDLDKAIGRLESVAARLENVVARVTGPDVGSSVTHGNLSLALLSRHQRSGDARDVEAAVAHARTGLAHAPQDEAVRAERATQLGKALHARHQLLGAPADLDEAIDVLTTARPRMPAGHPKRSALLSALAIALHTQYKHSGALGDLTDAISAHRTVVDLLLPENPQRLVAQSDLAVVLWSRYERTRDRAAIDEGITILRTVCDATPADHPQRPGRLDNLAILLRSRFAGLGERGDWQDAVAAAEAALAATPESHPDHAMHANNLAGILLTPFHADTSLAPVDPDPDPRSDPDPDPRSGSRPGSRSGQGFEADVAALDRAVTAARSAVAATGRHAPARGGYLSVLGNALRLRHDRTHDAEDRDDAAASWEEAAGTAGAAPTLRIHAARALASLLRDTDLPRARRALEAAVPLLQLTVPRHLERDDRQHALSDVPGLAGDAAALVLADPSLPAAERPERALAVLESGRSVLLGQALDIRGSLADVRAHAPELADRFILLRDRLDGPSRPAPVTEGDPVPASGRRQRWAKELDAVLKEIRGLPRLADFAAPLAREELLAQAGQGPVVTFNLSTFGSHALLLTTEGVTAVELPALTPERTARSVDAFHHDLRVTSDRKVSGARRLAAQDRLGRTLAELWTDAVLPVLKALGLHSPPPSGSPLPRVWWAPGGLLGMLPLHAAGVPGGESLLDHAVSSYVPTIRALRHARGRSGPRSPHPALIVSMPVTPGPRELRDLRHAVTETDAVRRHLPEAAFYATGEVAERAGVPAPRRAAVLADLPGRAVTHFACHATTDHTDPSRSALLLADHATAPLTVADLTAIDLDRAFLAYLSACTTATTRAADLLDEAVHLAAAFQLAGFPHVIGTLWEVQDLSAAGLAATFYDNLSLGSTTTGSPSGRSPDPARALHTAVSELRRAAPRLPSLWAAHIHLGA